MTTRSHTWTRLPIAALGLIVSLASVAEAPFGPRQTAGDLNGFGSFDQALFDQSGDHGVEHFATS
ncbi:MAG: hypothetical protein AAFP86_14420 [Planctomycetota bacterium]